MPQPQMAAAAPPLRQILTACMQHIQQLEDTRLNGHLDLYHTQFQELKQFSESLKGRKEYLCIEGEKDVNRKKNRYKDILPFDSSRVILREQSGIPGSDYVNANYVRGASGSRAYIASQAPLPNTVNDFWRMVVECQVQVIVMACNADDERKTKLTCERYWVDQIGEERTFGAVTVRLVRASAVCEDFLVRTMRVSYTSSDSRESEERTVCQFQYSAWPDHGVPGLVRPLVEMVRLMRETQASETLPVLVHCSAGCGRTGTICAIDYVWGLLRLGKLTTDFSVLAMVKEMRRQRVAMVQTKEQYVLVHQAVRELLRDQLQLIDDHPYVNIDALGLPLMDEKRDLTEKHVQRRKSSSGPHSKQEKEAENLTEKHRLSLCEKEILANSSPGDSLSRRQKIACLKSIFDRNTAKERKHQPVTRSHSIGPVHLDKSQNMPIKKSGKLVVPKLDPGTANFRPVAQIKRSKSLKVSKDNKPPSLSLIELPPPISSQHISMTKPVYLSRENIFEKKLSLETTSVKKRRSLESLIGDEPQITWPTLIKSPLEKTKPVLNIKQQLQEFSNRQMNLLASELGIRERRNSFRQAVTKGDPILKSVRKTDSEVLNSIEEHSTIHVDGLSKKLQDGLTVKSLNGQTTVRKTVDNENYENMKIKQSPQKSGNQNRFLLRLNQEIHKKFYSPRRKTGIVSPSVVKSDSTSNDGQHRLYTTINIQHLNTPSGNSKQVANSKPANLNLRQTSAKLSANGSKINSNELTALNSSTSSLQQFLDNAGVKFTEKPIKYETIRPIRELTKSRRGRFEEELLRQEGGSESSGSSGARELHNYINQSNEPRIIGVHSADSSPSTVSSGIAGSSRSASTSAALARQLRRPPPPMQSQMTWDHALGVDLDAIAAKMEQEMKKTYVKPVSSAPQTPVKKQQYF